MRSLYFPLVFATCCASGGAAAQTPIHQCKDADGGIVYSQLPCKDEEPAAKEIPPEPDEPRYVAPETAVIESPVSSDSQEEPRSDESRAACKKRYRDAIDAIDAEIRREYTPEKDGEYKQRLLALTRKLRACQ